MTKYYNTICLLVYGILCFILIMFHVQSQITSRVKQLPLCVSSTSHLCIKTVVQSEFMMLRRKLGNERYESVPVESVRLTAALHS